MTFKFKHYETNNNTMENFLITIIPIASLFIMLGFSKNKSIDLKTIVFLDEIFYYSVVYNQGWPCTSFYTRILGKERKWKFCNIPLFGSKIDIWMYNRVFYIEEDISLSCYSKEEVKAMINKGYEKYQRKLEIERGEII